MYTRQDWAIAFLHGLGNSHPSQNIINWVVAWTKLETTTGGGASYNLLNTTQTMPGSTRFNSVGVQNFTSFDQGIQANVKVLNNGRYPSVLYALQNNNETMLGFGPGGGTPFATIQQNLQVWSGGTNYASSILRAANGQGLNDAFSGTATGTGAQLPGSATPNVPPTTGNTFTTASFGTDLLAALGIVSPAETLQRFGLVFFGGLLVLIGLVIVFFYGEASKT